MHARSQLLFLAPSCTCTYVNGALRLCSLVWLIPKYYPYDISPFNMPHYFPYTFAGWNLCSFHSHLPRVWHTCRLFFGSNIWLRDLNTTLSPTVLPVLTHFGANLSSSIAKWLPLHLERSTILIKKICQRWFSSTFTLMICQSIIQLLD